jgi:release factor glutamine methyltransferase
MTVGELQTTFLSSSSETRLAPEDFFVLLAEATGKDKTFLLTHPEYVLDAETEATVHKYFDRRLQHEPVAYIVGHKEFYGRDFLVTPDTLVPRPETEHLVESVLKHVSTISQQLTANSQYKIVIVDVGTGSGNIIITLAKEIPSLITLHSSLIFSATDISAGALTVAQENAKRHKVSDAISFHKGSLLEPIDKAVFETAGEVIIAANLPYLSEEIYQASHDDVKLFEPETALVSDRDGLDHYYRLLEETKEIQKPITLFLEISPEQTPIITKYLTEHFPQAKISIHQDLSARDRVVEIRL